jgi:hypothetical protein
MRRYVGYLWAAPVTLPAMAIGFLCVAFGRAQVRTQDGVLEFYGGAIGKLLDHLGLPGIGGMPAMTMGHVVWYRDRRELRRWRRHEFVHVAQFERWGLFVVPAFYVFALGLVLRGRHPYYDNPIELEAYGKVAFPHEVEGLPRPASAVSQQVAVSQASPDAIRAADLKPDLLTRVPNPVIARARAAT